MGPRQQTEDYAPHKRWFRSGHVQTVVGNFLRREHVLPEPTEEIVEVEAAGGELPASYVMSHCHWQPEAVRAERLTVLLVHGLEGSSSSHYVLGNADKAWHAGWNVIRMNMRSCGGTDMLSPSVYHCGRSDDVGSVVEHCVSKFGLKRVALVGYSMGGNLVLRYLGMHGRNVPHEIVAAVGISPSTDLALCSRALHEWRNRPYEWHFLRGMVQRYREKARLFPAIYAPGSADGLTSLRDFDHAVVARYSGFDSAEDYYAKCSAGDVADGISVPTLVLHALDDPFIRMSQATRARLLANPHIRYIETRHGGHCAFLSETENAFGSGRGDPFWAERTLMRFLENIDRDKARTSDEAVKRETATVQ